MDIRLATDDDLKAMADDSISRGCLGQIPDTTDFAYAIEDDGALLAVGGVQLMNPTTAWAWIDLAAQAPDKMVGLFRLIRDHLDSLMREKGLTRLMAAVLVDFPEAVRLVEHLGFVRESRMARWLGDKAAFMYVRLGGGPHA